MRRFNRLFQGMRQTISHAMNQSFNQAVGRAGQAARQAVGQAVGQSVGQAARQAVGHVVNHVEQTIRQTLTQLQYLFTPCVLCNKLGQGPLCTNCLKTFQFIAPSCFVCEKFIPNINALHPTCKNTYANTIFNSRVEPSNSLITDSLVINVDFSFACFYNYTKPAKKLLFALKKHNNRHALWAFNKLFEYYAQIDAFNIIKHIRQYFSRTNVHNVFIPMPMNPLSSYTRNINVVHYFARKLQHILTSTQQNNKSSIFAKQLIFLNKTSKTQKQLSRHQRLLQAQKNIKINTALCKQIINNFLHLHPQPALTQQPNKIRKITDPFTRKTQNTQLYLNFVLIDDVSTTKATLYYASKKLLHCTIHQMRNIISKQNLTQASQVKNIHISIILIAGFCVNKRIY